MLLHILAVIFALAVLIAFHEFGHFICAKALNVPVKIFSVGFPMGNAKPLFRFQWGETDVQLNPLPLGGFCAFLDDRMLEEESEEGEEQIEFEPGDQRLLKNRKIWERTIIISGGVIANTICAYIIFVGLAWQGIPYVPIAKDHVAVSQNDLQPNDHILRVNGVPAKNNLQLQDELRKMADPAAPRTVQAVIERGGQQMTVPITLSKKGKVPGLNSSKKAMVAIGKVFPDSPSEKAGFKQGDIILTIEGTPITSPSQMQEIVKEKPGQQIQVEVQRQNGDKKEKVTLTPTPSEKGTIGVQIGIGINFNEIKRPIKSFMEPLVQGWVDLKFTFYFLSRALWDLVRGALPLNQLGGLVEIVHIGSRVSESYGLTKLIEFSALISVELAILNILPIPALDGGHLFLLLIEKVRGRPLPRAIEERLHYTGFMVLLGLGVLLIFKDIWGLLGAFVN